MEELVSLIDLCKPDSRNLPTVLIDRKTNASRYFTIEDLYRTVESISLNPNVPDDIRSQFNVARNLAIYTYFCYSFHQISELKAYSTLEHALKIKFKKDKASLKQLLTLAAESGLLKDKNFSHITSQITDPESVVYVQKLPEIIPKLRNELAHGSKNLYPLSVTNLGICADLINQLFP